MTKLIAASLEYHWIFRMLSNQIQIEIKQSNGQQLNSHQIIMLSNEQADDQQDPVRFNRRAWDDMAKAGDRYYKAVTSEQISAARKSDWKIRVTPQKQVPRDWLEPIRDRRVLCLAAGGGQQAPMLAAAGISGRSTTRPRLAPKRLVESGGVIPLKCYSFRNYPISCLPPNGRYYNLVYVSKFEESY